MSVLDDIENVTGEAVHAEIGVTLERLERLVALQAAITAGDRRRIQDHRRDKLARERAQGG
ncbi:MAG: hypothetical protein ABW167_20010 [Baekduia sp.]